MEEKLLLHICCGPCASYVSYLCSLKFSIVGYYYNPNIYPKEEYQKRRGALEKLSRQTKLKVIFERYNLEDYFNSLGDLGNSKARSLIKANRYRELESLIAAGKFVITQDRRCPICYKLRLEKTAKKAKELGFNYFTTTLLISPYQKLAKIRKIGENLSRKYGVEFYFEDFRPGFLKSKELSRSYNLYSQRYCGCIFSKLKK